MTAERGRDLGTGAAARPRRPARRGGRGWAPPWWPSAAAPTRRWWRRWRPRCSGADARRCVSRPCRRRSPPRSSTTAGRWRGSGGCRGRRSTPMRSTTPPTSPTAPTAATTARRACMDALAPLAAARRATVVLGVNVDDLGEHRPGQRAASERGARFPLVEAGLTKADVRAPVAPARPAHLGQARRRLPGVAPALRHAGVAFHAERRGPGRVGPAGARVRAAARASLRGPRSGRVRRRRPAAGVGPRAMRWWPPCGRRAIAT